MPPIGMRILAASVAAAMVLFTSGRILAQNGEQKPSEKPPAAEGKDRLWRFTNVATQSPGGVMTLAPHSIGYESDEDVDNGFRPGGLIWLSTTTGATPQYLRDFGLTVTPGTTTHHLTLYRAASGALVFSAGTIQWAWGLDNDHDGVNPAAADSRMQQATVNLLADMGVQPTSLMTGLTASSASSDAQPPTVTITSPVGGTSMANGALVTMTGTATDAGGGVVAEPAFVQVENDPVAAVDGIDQRKRGTLLPEDVPEVRIGGERRYLI